MPSDMSRQAKHQSVQNDEARFTQGRKDPRLRPLCSVECFQQSIIHDDAKINAVTPPAAEHLRVRAETIPG